MKKLLYVIAFVSSATLGAACSSELTEACEDYVAVRDECEAVRDACEDDNECASNQECVTSVCTDKDPPKYMIDLCANIDPECEAFFKCAARAKLNIADPEADFCEKDSNKRYRLDINALNDALAEEAKQLGIEFVECKEPENKACTDADLRP